MLFVFLLLAGGGGAEAYKIRRTECSMADTTSMVCTCGGIGDPYSIIMNKVRLWCQLYNLVMARLGHSKSEIQMLLRPDNAPKALCCVLMA